MEKKLNPDLLKVMQEAETTKEDDLKRVKEEAGKKTNLEINEQIEANQMAGMPLEEAIYQAGYTHGVEFEQKRNQAIGLGLVHPPAEAERGEGAVWVKAETKPEYNVGVLVLIPGEDNHITSGMWDISNEWVLLDEYRVPDCEVTHWMPLPGLPEGVETFDLPDELGQEIKKLARKELGLDESGEKDDWISVDDQLPTEGGRYWCYVMHQGDLGVSYFQWNCDYNDQLKRFSDMTLTRGEVVTHWRKLPDPPPRKEVPNG